VSFPVECNLLALIAKMISRRSSLWKLPSSGCIEFSAFGLNLFVVDVVDVGGGEGERQGGECYCCELEKREEEKVR